jgi:hypothetical protein
VPVMPAELSQRLKEQGELRPAARVTSVARGTEMPPDDRFDDCPPSMANAKAPPFKVWTPEEIWEPLPPVEYAIGGLVPRTSLVLTVAYGSSLKTWMMTDLVVAKALGEAWLGKFPCEPGAVLFFDWESGDHELRRRLQRVSAARGHVGPVAGVSMVTMPDLFFNSGAFEEQVTELARPRAVVVFDSLAAGTVDVDENDARFAQGLQTLKRIATKTGCTFIVLHHSRKQPPQGKDADARESPRGTGAIFAACDVVLHLTRAEEGAMLVTQTKARAGKAIEPFTVRVEDVGPDATRVFAGDAPVPGDDDAFAPGDALQRAKATILRVLGRDHDVTSMSELARRVSGRKQTVKDALEELTARSIVTHHGGCFRLASEVSSERP